MKKHYQRKHWFIWKCDFCGCEELPKETRFSKVGSPKRDELPDGWGYTGCLDKNNLRAWCPLHNKPMPRKEHHAISPPLRPLTKNEIDILVLVRE